MKKIALLLFAFSSVTFADIQRILPEVSTSIELSNRDVNRLVCANGGPLTPGVYSEEKPIIVQQGQDGRSYYVKFKVLQNSETLDNRYFSEPTELYLSCGKSVFELVIKPTYTDAKTVWLGNNVADKMHENQELMGAMSLEEASIMLATSIIKDSNQRDALPSSFTEIKSQNAPWVTGLTDKQGRPVAVKIKKVRDVLVEGTGLRASEYTISADSNVYLDELMFMKREFGTNIFTITLEQLAVSKGMKTTLVVVQREGV